MNPLVVTTPSAITPERPQPAGMCLRGRWLLFARLVWLAIAVLSLSLFVAGVPAEFAQLQVECPTAVCLNGQLPPDGLRALQELGLSLDFFAAYGVGLDIVVAVVYSAVAALIFWRTAADRIALFVALTLLTFGTATFPEALYALAAAHPPTWPLVAGLNFLGSTAFSLFLLLFPDGRFVPGWTRWVALGWIAWQVPKYWIATWPDVTPWTAWLNTVVWLVALGTVVSAQVYRYRWVSSSVQRQQTKWVVFGIAAALTGYLGVIIVLAVVAPAPISARALAALMGGFAIMYLVMLLIPLSIGMAVLRYRLFDVDSLINRTLVYGALTGTLALAYLTCVVLIQALARPLAGAQPSQLLTVASTLAIVALFSPLRRHIQMAIDRRFYRRKYDAARTLAAFSAQLRDEVELQTLIAELLMVVEETMQPAGVSLWLCEPLRKGQQTTFRSNEGGEVAPH